MLSQLHHDITSERPYSTRQGENMFPKGYKVRHQGFRRKERAVGKANERHPAFHVGLVAIPSPYSVREDGHLSVLSAKGGRPSNGPRALPYLRIYPRGLPVIVMICSEFGPHILPIFWEKTTQTPNL
jgi:hypothetical protein